MITRAQLEAMSACYRAWASFPSGENVLELVMMVMQHGEYTKSHSTVLFKRENFMYVNCILRKKKT